MKHRQPEQQLQQAKKPRREHINERLLRQWLEMENIAYEREHVFCEGRRWRFDYALTKQKIAVEVEGGLWIQGRHNRAPGMIADMSKYNEAAILGWTVLRYTPQELNFAIRDLMRILGRGC